MKINKLFDLEINSFIELYKKKLKAEKSFDQKLINELTILCPELFSEETKPFIKNLKKIAEQLENKYGQKFVHHFEFDLEDENKSSH